MSRYVSVALLRRADGVVFRPPRNEPSTSETQVRKAASIYWRNQATTSGDKLVKIFVVRKAGEGVEIAERGPRAGERRAWVSHIMDAATAAREPHIAACMAELGIDPDDVPPPMPDVLVINGRTYRADI